MNLFYLREKNSNSRVERTLESTLRPALLGLIDTLPKNAKY